MSLFPSFDVFFTDCTFPFSGFDMTSFCGIFIAHCNGQAGRRSELGLDMVNQISERWAAQRMYLKAQNDIIEYVLICEPEIVESIVGKITASKTFRRIGARRR